MQIVKPETEAGYLRTLWRRIRYGGRVTRRRQYDPVCLELVSGGEHPLQNLVRGADDASYVDHTPWNHPFLTQTNLDAFRAYGECVWDFVSDYVERNPLPDLRIGLTNNLAQNLYNWGRLLSERGADVTLIPDPQDFTVLSCPEWEEYDGEWDGIFDGPKFLKSRRDTTRIPVVRLEHSDLGSLAALDQYVHGNRLPLLAMMNAAPTVRFLELNLFYQCGGLTNLATELGNYDVLCTQSSSPIASYFSGRPYSSLYVGGDLQHDCGRGDWYGRLMHYAFGRSRFLFVGGPDGIAYSRRLGLRNAVFFPTPIDTTRYSPGEGAARARWTAQTGKEVFVLTTARIDSGVKGNGAELITTLEGVARRFPQVCFVFLKWGNDRDRLADRLEQSPQRDSFLLLSPVGKRRLIDYYRSADVVLDQFVYGYYGMTGFETAAVGKPIVINLRTQHYAPLYSGDVMPANHAANPEEIAEQLTALIPNPEYRAEQGRKMRGWALRNHNDTTNVERLHTMLMFTFRNRPLPELEVPNPLASEFTMQEHDYHEQHCRVGGPLKVAA